MSKVITILFSSTLVLLQIVRILRTTFKVVVRYKGTGNIISDNNKQAGRDEESTTSLVGGVTNAVGVEAVRRTGGEKTADTGPDSCWTLG